MTFTKAERKKAKLRLGICGTSGSGKTYSALLIAKGLGKKIAVLDTENHSAELYAGKEGMPEYDVCTLSPPYDTEKYVQSINEAERLGYDVIILDSISHAWAGEGGLLDQQGKIADSGKGNSYTAWRNVTPKHNKFIEKMLSCNLHLIATMRSKTEYALVTNDKGKQEPKKIGMAPIQREGMDYEFTVVFDIDQNHNAIPSKDRTGLFDKTIFTPTTGTGEALLLWLDSGKEVAKDDVPAHLGSIITTISQTSVEDVENNGKLVKVYSVVDAGNVIFKTTNKAIFDVANICVQENKKVKINYNVKPTGTKEVLSIVDPTAKTTPSKAQMDTYGT